MTPKEKAKELFKKYFNETWEHGATLSKPMIKRCALMAADEVFESYKKTKDAGMSLVPVFNFWQQVKEEIEKL
jgi:tmRNA-binding protein